MRCTTPIPTSTYLFRLFPFNSTSQEFLLEDLSPFVHRAFEALCRPSKAKHSTQSSSLISTAGKCKSCCFDENPLQVYLSQGGREATPKLFSSNKDNIRIEDCKAVILELVLCLYANCVNDRGGKEEDVGLGVTIFAT